MSRLMNCVALVLPLLFLLAGCVEEDAITITGDGLVTFKSVVTIRDDERKVSFADADKGVSDLLTELQQAKWIVERRWISEKRPYAFEVSGKGNLRDVAPLTRFYALSPIVRGFYRVAFLAPQGEDGKPTLRRIVFTSPASEPIATVHDSEGRLITQIDNVAANGGPFGIRLLPAPVSTTP